MSRPPSRRHAHGCDMHVHSPNRDASAHGTGSVATDDAARATASPRLRAFAVATALAMGGAFVNASAQDAIDPSSSPWDWPLAPGQRDAAADAADAADGVDAVDERDAADAMGDVRPSLLADGVARAEAAGAAGQADAIVPLPPDVPLLGVLFRITPAAHALAQEPAASTPTPATLPQALSGPFPADLPVSVAASPVDNRPSPVNGSPDLADGPPLPADAMPQSLPTPAAPAPNYLFGTIHFGTDTELGIDATQLDAALAGAHTLVGELDLDAAAATVDDAIALDAMRWLPPETPLSSLIDADALAMARYLLPAVEPPTLERMKPWLVLALLEARGEALGDDTLDVRLQRKARARGMRVVPLETVVDQLSALDCVPSAQQAVVLQERLKAPWIQRELSQRALDHYRGRDLGAWMADVDRMSGLGDEGRAIEARARRCLVEDRNARWLPVLATMIDAGGHWIAVGAIHLPGEHGLLAALARAGYRIEATPL